MLNKEFTPNRFGFTLIELIVVMAVLGILATLTLVAVNPLEQVAKTNDAKVKQAVSQVGGSVTSYYAQRQAFPTVSTTWMDRLIATGDLSDRPSQSGESCNPSSASDTNYCLQVSNGAAVIYARLTSQNDDTKCTTSSDVPYFLYDTSRGRACLVCGAENAIFSSGVTCTAEF